MRGATLLGMHLRGMEWNDVFGMTIVRTYTSAFTLAMGGEVIRILYRSRERVVVLQDSKPWDFASYSLPRLAVSNGEEEQEAPSNRSKKCHRYE